MMFSRIVKYKADLSKWQASSRPIIFVAHSLGGLVVKQALVEAAQSNSKHDQSILQSCVGLLFFGVPNRGLNNSNLETLVKNQKNAPFVSSLREGSELLRILHQSMSRAYPKSLKSCLVASFYESKDTNTVEVSGSKVIDRLSTNRYEE